MNGSHHTLHSTATEQARQISAAQARKLIEANDMYAHSNRADTAIQERSYSRLAAKLLVVEVLTDSPQSAEALNLLGRIELDLGHVQESVVCFDNAIALDPLNTQYQTNRGYAALASSQHDEAIAYFNAALVCKRSNVNAFTGIATALQRKGDFLGAFLHFKSLYEKGISSRLIETGLSECCKYLKVDHYDSALEQLALDLLNSSEIDKDHLDAFVASLLVAKYDLSNDEAVIELDTLAQDKLLLTALNHTRMSNLYIENLLTALRQNIFLNGLQTGELPESLQEITAALGVYAARLDYAFSETDDETQGVNIISQEIAQTCRGHWSPEDVIAAVMLLAMYRSIYQEAFNYHLLKHDLSAWPVGSALVLKASLYEQSDEHLYEFPLPGKPEDLYQIEHVRPFPRWTQLGWESEADYMQLLKTELKLDKLPESFTNKRLAFLIADCGTGRRALRIAKYFANVEVLAIDSRKENIAYAIKKAKDLNIQNVQFLVAQPDDLCELNKRFDVIECNSGMAGYTNIDETIATFTRLMQDEGILRLGLYRQAARNEVQQIQQLIKDKGISPVSDNVRALRRAIIDDVGSGCWNRVLNTPDFYSVNGTRALLFAQNEHAFNLKGVQQLLGEQRLSFLGFAGIPAEAAEQLPRMSKQNLAAWHDLEMRDPDLFTDAYFFFSRKFQS
ncbi:MAG: methyltransferase domain-containing protein [Hahellaceae bacterium]|nr:methyltransferase domain-containing protein [Hahellaceae bacterium]